MAEAPEVVAVEVVAAEVLEEEADAAALDKFAAGNHLICLIMNSLIEISWINLDSLFQIFTYGRA